MAIAAQGAAKPKPNPAMIDPPRVEGGIDGLECSMDGFVKMSSQITENLLLLLALAKETLAVMMPKELNLTIQYMWDGAVGLNNWLGYGIAAIYYVGTDYDFGLVWCEIMGYGYYVIDGLNYIVDFAGIAPEEGQTPEEAVAGLAGQLSGVVEAAASGDVDALVGAATDVATDAVNNSGELIDKVSDGVNQVTNAVSDIQNAVESA